MPTNRTCSECGIRGHTRRAHHRDEPLHCSVCMETTHTKRNCLTQLRWDTEAALKRSQGAPTVEEALIRATDLLRDAERQLTANAAHLEQNVRHLREAEVTAREHRDDFTEIAALLNVDLAGVNLTTHLSVANRRIVAAIRDIILRTAPPPPAPKSPPKGGLSIWERIRTQPAPTLDGDA
jgi:hypothetical protein